MEQTRIDSRVQPSAGGALVLSPQPDSGKETFANEQRSGLGPYTLASLITLAWLLLCFAYAVVTDAAFLAGVISPEELALFVTITLAPVAVIWLSAVTTANTRDLRASTEKLEQQLAALAYPDGESTRRVTSVVNTLKEQAKALNAATEAAQLQTEAMEQSFREQTDSLKTLSDLVEQRAVRARSLMQDRNRELSETADSLSERAERIGEVIDTGTLRLASASSEASERTRITQTLLSNSTEDLMKAADGALERTSSIDERFQSFIHDLNKATARAKEQAEDLTDQYTQQTQALRQATDTLDERTREITRSLAQEVKAVEDTSEAATARAREIEETVRAHAQTLEQIISRTRDDASRAADYFSAQAAFMEDSARQAISGIDTSARDAAQEISQRSASLIELSETFGATVERSRQHFEGAMSAYRDQNEEIRRETSLTAGTIAREANRSKELVQTQLGQLAEATSLAGEQTEKLGKRIAEATTLLHETSEQNVASLNRAGDTLGRRSAQLAQLTAAAISKARDLGDLMENASDRLETSSGRSAKTIRELNDMLESSTSVLRSLSLEIAERSRSIEERMARQVTAISDSSAHASRDIQHLEAQIERTSDTLTKATEAANARVLDAGKDILETVHLLRSSSHDSAGQLEAGLAALRSGVSDLEEHTGQAMSRMDRIRGALEAHDKSAQSITDSAAERLMSVSEILEIVSRKITDLADETTERVSRSAGQLGGVSDSLGEKARDSQQMLDEARDHFENALDAINEKAQKVGQHIGETGTTFKQTANKMTMDAEKFRADADGIMQSAQELVMAARKVGEEASHADVTFQKRAANLVNAADGLADTIRRLEEMERDATGAAFMKTAHNVMEQLGSLAIDIDRIMESDIPERVWKQYHAGDTSAFARRLLKSGGRATEKRIAEQFETDGDFRKTVMSYLSQFERVIDQAGRVDKADALNAALLSSHIGKLYVMLARAVNRIH